MTITLIFMRRYGCWWFYMGYNFGYDWKEENTIVSINVDDGF